MVSVNVSVIKVRDFLMATVPPDPEDETILSMQRKVLEDMARFETRGLILDLSLVETFDSFFARAVIETAQMVALMGGRTIIAGMGVQVAITATQFGLRLGDVETALDVDRALDMLEHDVSER